MIWMCVAIALFIIEVFTGAVAAFCIGMGALGAGVIALTGYGVAWQLAVGVVCILLSLIYLAPMVRRYRGKLYSRNPDYNTNMDALVGREGIVTEAYRGPGEYGRMSLDGASWQIINHDTTVPLHRGTRVRVVSYHSIILTVAEVGQ